jgi:hypothetical protein
VEKMTNKIFKFKMLIILLTFWVMIVSCNFNDNNIKIISIDPIEGLSAGVSQLLIIEIEYTLSTDETGYIWIGFNSYYNILAPNPNNFPTSESYNIKKGSGRITFIGTVTPIDWSLYNSSFDVMATLSAHNNGRLGDIVVDRKVIME